MTQRPRRTKGGTASLLRRSLITVRESPGRFPVDSSSGRVTTQSAVHALAWVVRARAGMTAPQRDKNRSCGTWSCVGTPTTRAIAIPRREPTTPRRSAGLAAPALRCVRFHRRGTRHPDAGNRAARGRPGRHTDHPDDVGQGAWHCTVRLVYGVLHGLVLPVWRGDGI